VRDNCLQFEQIQEKKPALTESGPRELVCVSCTTFLKKLLTDPLTPRIIHL
jgi:hypothetical protein